MRTGTHRTWGGQERELWLEIDKERQRPGGIQDQQARTELVFAATFYKTGPL